MVPPSRNKLVKVNLGCGKNALPDWINYDISPKILLSRIPWLKKLLCKIKLVSKRICEEEWPSYIIRRDLRKGINLPNNSVDYIYCSHFLEHLSYYEAFKLLKECYRVLKPGGRLRIVVPDLKRLALEYISNKINAIVFIKKLYIIDNRPFIKKIIFSHSIHHSMYDFDILQRMLLASGFKEIEEKNFREGKFPDLKRLDARSSESLFVETTK